MVSWVLIAINISWGTCFPKYNRHSASPMRYIWFQLDFSLILRFPPLAIPKYIRWKIILYYSCAFNMIVLFYSYNWKVHPHRAAGVEAPKSKHNSTKDVSVGSAQHKCIGSHHIGSDRIVGEGEFQALAQVNRIEWIRCPPKAFPHECPDVQWLAWAGTSSG